MNDGANVRLGRIEIRLARPSQLYESLDPSPFWDKDLDADADQYIVSCARDLPHDAALELVVQIDSPLSADERSDLESAVHAHFRRRADEGRRRLRALMRQGRVSLAIGLLFLAASIGVGDLLKLLGRDSTIAALVGQGVLIGGWVAMWRPLEIFLYDWWPIARENRLFDRLGAMAVTVRGVA